MTDAERLTAIQANLERLRVWRANHQPDTQYAWRCAYDGQRFPCDWAAELDDILPQQDWLLAQVQALQAETARLSAHLEKRHHCDFGVPSPAFDWGDEDA